MAYLLSLCMKFSRYIRVSAVVTTIRVFLVSITYILTLVELRGFEPLTPCLQGRCSPN